MGTFYELIAILSFALTPKLHEKIGIPNISLVDAILLSIVIPFLHLMNDDDTKGIIFEENWFQGIKYVLGLYKQPDVPGNHRQQQHGRNPGNGARVHQRNE